MGCIQLLNGKLVRGVFNFGTKNETRDRWCVVRWCGGREFRIADGGFRIEMGMQWNARLKDKVGQADGGDFYDFGDLGNGVGICCWSGDQQWLKMANHSTNLLGFCTANFSSTKSASLNPSNSSTR